MLGLHLGFPGIDGNKLGIKFQISYTIPQHIVIILLANNQPLSRYAQKYLQFQMYLREVTHRYTSKLPRIQSNASPDKVRQDEWLSKMLMFQLAPWFRCGIGSNFT